MLRNFCKRVGVTMLRSISQIWRGERELSKVFLLCFVVPAVAIDFVQIPLVHAYITAPAESTVGPIFNDPLLNLFVWPMFFSTLPLQSPWLVWVIVSMARAKNTLGYSRPMAIFWVGIQVAITLLIPVYIFFSALAAIG